MLRRSTKSDQVCFYHAGVGTGRGSGKFSKLYDKCIGGSLGIGIVEILNEAFLDLVLNYADGDEVFVFGWSRGAYLARLFLEFLRMIGLPTVRNLHEIRYFMKVFLHDQRDGNGSEHLGASGMIGTAAFLWDRTQIAREIGSQEWEVAVIFDPDFVNKSCPEIKYLGMWDCVAAIGSPSQNRFRFLNSTTTATVEFSRHALAADERRNAFQPLFDKHHVLPNHEVELFPGDHAVVGGGSASSLALSLSNFVWVVEHAVNLGLKVEESELDALRSGAGHTGSIGSESTWKEKLVFGGFSSRDVSGIHRSEVFKARQKSDASYWKDFNQTN